MVIFDVSVDAIFKKILLELPSESTQLTFQALIRVTGL